MAKTHEQHLRGVILSILLDERKEQLAQLLQSLADQNPASFDRRAIVERMVKNIRLFNEAEQSYSRRMYQLDIIYALIKKSRLKTVDLIAPLALLE